MRGKKQKPILGFVKSYSKKNGYAPSLEEIKRKFGFASVSTAHYHIKKLQEAGLLKKEYNQPRSVSATKQKTAVEVPLVGIIAAGEPIEAIENAGETISIARDEIGKIGRHFALRVSGNSMIDEGIYDGDIVVIRQQVTAYDGQTVVAIIDDNEATLKKLYREKDRFRLQPANPSLFPFYRREVEVRGVVVKIIRNLEPQIEKAQEKNEKYTRRIDYSWDFRG